jgi:zinc transporter ZupT
LLTSLGALAGSMVGYYLGTMYMKQCLAFTSGGFLYFAINGLMSELKDVKSFFELFNCILAIILGLYFMYLFALFE